MLNAGTRLGPYKITAKLGEGSIHPALRARGFHPGRSALADEPESGC